MIGSWTYFWILFIVISGNKQNRNEEIMKISEQHRKRMLHNQWWQRQNEIRIVIGECLCVLRILTYTIQFEKISIWNDKFCQRMSGQKTGRVTPRIQIINCDGWQRSHFEYEFLLTVAYESIGKPYDPWRNGPMRNSSHAAWLHYDLSLMCNGDDGWIPFSLRPYSPLARFHGHWFAFFFRYRLVMLSFWRICNLYFGGQMKLKI